MHSALKQMAKDRDILREMAEAGGRSGRQSVSQDVLEEKLVRSDPPDHFHCPYLVSRPTPYQSCDSNGREHICGGVLRANQVVWLEQPLHRSMPVQRVTAFTPSVGVIRVDSRCLSVARQQP